MPRYHLSGTQTHDKSKLRLVLAGGDELPIVSKINAAVKLSEVPEHSFILMEQLISLRHP